MVGAAGTTFGVTALDGVDAGPVNTAEFDAVTIKV
jgi:hypothetical protein